LLGYEHGADWNANISTPRYRSLNTEQAMVYGLIDEAGADGIWTKTIKAKLKLHDTLMKTALKHLEGKNMISDMKSVENPTRKMYILSSLRPSERATGGPWYTDGELDEEFITMVTSVVFAQISKRSFYKSSSAMLRKPTKTVTKGMTATQAKAARDKALSPNASKEEDAEDERSVKRRKYEAQFPMPADYKDYPNVHELTAFVENAGITDITLTSNEIQQVLDIMCYDGKIEKIIGGSSEGVGYKAVRKTLRDMDEIGSVLNEAPCGRCPVFDLCQEGGPVAPSSCEYFKEWLDM
jgi:DNA-directed RNA polymerase III subunit RPC6